MDQPTVTYFISHPNLRNKKNAIATLEVFKRLGYNHPIEDSCRVTADGEIQILASGSLLRATINIYNPSAKPIASEDELPHLDVTFNS
jgi:hypothetical protein